MTMTLTLMLRNQILKKRKRLILKKDKRKLLPLERLLELKGKPKMLRRELRRELRRKHRTCPRLKRLLKKRLRKMKMLSNATTRSHLSHIVELKLLFTHKTRGFRQQRS